MLPRYAKMKSDFGISNAIGSILVWILLSIITLGLALFFFPYYFQKDVLNKSFIVDMNDNRIGKVKCNLNFGDAFGHAFLWILLTIVTLGLALFVYQYRVTRFVYNQTEFELLE